MIEPAIVQASDAQRWQRARVAVHAWRGELIDHFARAEAEISEALLAIGCAANELLMGRRTARLVAAVAPDGSHARDGVHVRGALVAFQKHDHLRHALCHGREQIALDQQGHWVVVLRMVRLRADGVHRTTMTFDEAEAAAVLRTVTSSTAILIGQIRRMCQVTAASPSAPPGP